MIEQLPLWDLSLPIDLALSGWERSPLYPLWLTHRRYPGDVAIATSGKTLDETIEKARHFNRLFAEADARKAEAEAQKQTKRKKVAA